LLNAQFANGDCAEYGHIATRSNCWYGRLATLAEALALGVATIGNLLRLRCHFMVHVLWVSRHHMLGGYRSVGHGITGLAGESQRLAQIRQHCDCKKQRLTQRHQATQKNLPVKYTPDPPFKYSVHNCGIQPRVGLVFGDACQQAGELPNEVHYTQAHENKVR
jgi:hypothetical protein